MKNNSRRLGTENIKIENESDFLISRKFAIQNKVLILIYVTKHTALRQRCIKYAKSEIRGLFICDVTRKRI